MSCPMRLSLALLMGIWLSSLASPLSAQDTVAQESAISTNEIQAVFRISKEFLDENTDDEIDAQIPFCERVIGFNCWGTIAGTARLSIDMQSGGGQAVFAIDSVGNASAGVTGRHGPVVAIGSAWGTFSTRTLIRFDGRNFVHVATTPQATVCGRLCRVTGRLDRRAGRLLGRGMMPIANRMVPRAVAEAVPIANRYLKNFVEQTAQQIIANLNQKTPLEETVNRLFPKTREFIFHMSATEDFLQGAYGPSSADVPELAKESDWERINIEVWLRSTSDEAASIARLSELPLARELIDQYIETTLPELRLLGEEYSIEAAGDWLAIRFASGNTKD